MTVVRMAERLVHEARWRGPAHGGADEDVEDVLEEGQAASAARSVPLQAARVLGWSHCPARCQCAMRGRL
eukprot:7903603-Alexandrium_andersonii.AAC.1